MSVNERTYIMIKPDGVQRGLVGNIIARFEQRLVQATEAHLENHYSDLKGKPFFPGLIKYMASGPVVAMVWQGLDAVKTGRAMLGTTNPLQSPPGSIRGDFALAVGRNICHGSDSVESAEKEIKLQGVVQYTTSLETWIFE
ncbi:nucleoside diphosphate kinase [Multifurca ochricompacta]|uniref:Nucleoside diphosphate kinase n=1 Tax=Multifurca ochricompacta TaxID=376703 RepID=A0AAD4QNB5_9AGAM|nr:nucleoside diphosphate kinase [Multifurca ochricompacta]